MVLPLSGGLMDSPGLQLAASSGLSTFAKFVGEIEPVTAVEPPPPQPAKLVKIRSAASVLEKFFIGIQ